MFSMTTSPRALLLAAVCAGTALIFGSTSLRATDLATTPTPATPADLPPTVKAWLQTDAARAFQSSQGNFLRKVAADDRMSFVVPKLGASMVFVAPGKFEMGNEGGEDDEGPPTKVTITHGFWMGRYEVTQEEWYDIMDLRPARYKGPQRPVEFISWKAATEFCQKLTERERFSGRLPRGYVYRLPTEAEWEYVARLGGENGPNGVLPQTGWYAANSKKMTHPVGEKTPNALGIFDLYGNVSEWCQDWYARYRGAPVSDYTGPNRGDFRVARGGSWFEIAYGCTASYRTGAEPTVRSAGIGMRLVLAPEL